MMKSCYRNLLLPFILVIAIPLLTQAQIKLPDNGSLRASDNAMVYLDIGGAMGIHDIKRLPAEAFEPSATASVVVPRGCAAWVKLTVKNDGLRQGRFFAVLRNPTLPRAQFHVSSRHKAAGQPAEPSSLWRSPLRFQSHTFLALPGQVLDIYIRLDSPDGPYHVPIYLYDVDGFVTAVSNGGLATGIYYGFAITLIVMLLVLLGMRSESRLIVYLLLCAAAEIGLTLNTDGFGFLHLYPAGVPFQEWITRALPYTAFFAYGVFHLRLLRHYRMPYKRAYAAMALLTVASGALALATAATDLGKTTSIAASLCFGLGINVLALFIEGHGHRRVDQIPALFPVSQLANIAMTLYLVAFVVWPGDLYTTLLAGMKLASVATLTLMFAATVRYMGLRRQEAMLATERSRADLSRLKQDMNISTENMVRERTQALQEANRKLSDAAARNLAITEELHRQREMTDQKSRELELAFKKSSAQHVRLHKAFLKDQEQREKLAESLRMIREKNTELEKRTEEIVAQRDMINEQNQLLAERAESIDDSILYAQQIQKSVLPSDEEWRALLPESFILFRPKEALSGDIYWAGRIDDGGSQHRLVAAIDCTGHGIPGAMMSIIANDALRQAVQYRKLTSTDEIVNYMNESIVVALNKRGSGHHVNDGLDLALVVIDEGRRLLRYTGARNPIYLVSDGQLTETRGHLQSVGSPDAADPEGFPAAEIPYRPGDMLYLFSDGYADQFGGPGGRKLQYSRFRELLRSVATLGIDEQRDILQRVLDDWQGDNPQIDDILVIGVRL